jgi:hypothetical protein
MNKIMQFPHNKYNTNFESLMACRSLMSNTKKDPKKNKGSSYIIYKDR